MVCNRELVQPVELIKIMIDYKKIYKSRFSVNEFKRMCKNYLSMFVRVEIENDTKNKLYYITFRSCRDMIQKTISYKQMKDKAEMLELIQEIRTTLG